jgi:hypothetical protein
MNERFSHRDMRPGKNHLLFAIIYTLLLSTHGRADDAIGMTLVSRGDVEVISAGEPRPLGRGDFLAEKDEIVVGDRSFAVLQFVDGAKLSLRPDSSLIIEQYRYTGESDQAVTLNLLTGGMRVNQGAIASQHPAAFRIRIPSDLLIMSEPEGSLTLCGNEICDLQGLVESPGQ